MLIFYSYFHFDQTSVKFNNSIELFFIEEAIFVIAAFTSSKKDHYF